MAASRPSKSRPAITPELSELLQDARAQSKLGVSPTMTEEEATTLRRLFEVLSPSLVLDPRREEDSKPVKALREPLLLLSWDRRGGTWKASISDKVLNLSGSCAVRSLVTALADVETALADGTFRWGQRKVT